MLKVGDKLLCKKDETWFIDYSVIHYTYIEKTKYYTITDTFSQAKGSTSFCVSSNLQCTFFGIDVSVMIINNILCFSLNLNSKWYIWKYFYKPQELRKMKLNKLKQC